MALTGNGYNSDNAEEELSIDEDEVLALNLPSSKKQNQRHLDDDSEEDPPASRKNARITAAKQRNKDRDLQPLTDAKTSRFDRPTKKSKRSAAVAEASEAGKPSSEEDSDSSDGSASVNEDESQEEDASDEPEAPQPDDLGEDWARAGGYHVSKREMNKLEHNAQRAGRRPDDRDVERNALELYEARRIQKEGKAALAEDDYGLGDDDNIDLPVGGTDIAVSKPALLPVPKFASREEAIAHLVATEPELLALLDDLSASSERLGLVQATVKQMQIDLSSDNPKLGFAFLYQETMVTYLTTLAFYLHVRSDPGYATSGKEVAESALGRLVKLRSALSSLDDLGIIDLPGEMRRRDMYQDGESDEDDDLALEELDREALMAKIGDLDDDELDALIVERQAIMEHEGLPTSRTKRKLEAAGDDQASNMTGDASTSSSKRKRRKGKKEKHDEVVKMDLLNLAPVANTLKANPISISADTDLLDPTTLSSGDAEEKAGRTKSLRFYTSKIDSKSAKRSGAGKERAGGDDDVPYRSKERARAAALQRQQHAQQKSSGADLDDEDFLDGDLQDARDVVGDIDADAEGYYDLVVKGKQAAKDSKKQAYEDALLADRAANSLSQPLDPNNPRAVNRMIMANKGLTPKRPKSVRNPRVKKRMRYDQAQKKVASMKPVYKGGLGSASYEGEKSGISSRVVKSRSL